MRDEPNEGLKCRNIRSSDTTKGVGSSRQQDGGASRDETDSSADLGSSSKYSNENFED